MSTTRRRLLEPAGFGPVAHAHTMKKLGVNSVADLPQLALSTGVTQLTRGRAATHETD
jgi:hypothetical protein